MTHQLHPGHPDADQINTFVEGAASAHQREEMLAHLAECAECREVVFLLRGGEEAEPAVAVVPVARARRKWFLPLGLAGAALACGITAVVYLRVHVGETERPSQSAMVRAPEAATPALPEPVVPMRKSAPAARDAEGKERAPARQAYGGAGGSAGSVAGSEYVAKQAEAPPAVVEAPPPNASAGQPVIVTRPANAPIAPPASTNGMQRSLAEASPQPLPKVESKNETVTLAMKGRATAGMGAGLGTGSRGLWIEHDHGPDDGRSEIAGRVTDMSGAVIPHATVTARDAAGVTRQTTTDTNGNFSMAGVGPGHYDVTVTASGFESTRQTFDLKARDLASLDSVLRVGAEAETVEVDAAQAAVEAKSPAVSNAANSLAYALPGASPGALRVAIGKRMLSLDESGALFVSRDGGRKWKKVKPAWPGKVTRLAVANRGAETNKAGEVEDKRAESELAQAGKQVFEIGADNGSAWISDDGLHWRPR